MEKGGLSEALTAAGLAAGTAVAWADEMRVGLMGMVRRAWSPRGVKVRQRVQHRRQWTYLVLAVDGRTGRLWWTWTPDMKQDSLVRVLPAWRQGGVEAIVWDNASSHRAAWVRACELPLVFQPPYAPELNPAERLFEALRRAVEGVCYATIQEKCDAIDAELDRWDADPERVRRLAGWDWITDAFAALSSKNAA